MTRVVQPFAGAGGWDRAAQSLGLRPIGIEIDGWACATRAASGLLTILADVTTLTPASFGEVDGLVMSPPCTTFSIAGKRAGIDGETGRLMHEVPRWVEALRPRWVACEQVPPALPWWQYFAWRFRELGYKTWCGILVASNYGTPQHRARSFLLAHRDRQPHPPTPTHTQFPEAPLFGERLLPWVSMAEALGLAEAPTWEQVRAYDGEVRRFDSAKPAPTVCGHRKPAWLPFVRVNTRRDQRPDGSTQIVTLDRPAPSVTGKAGGQWVYERPATTVCGTPRIAQPGHHEHNWDGAIQVTLAELGVLQDFPLDHPWVGNKTQVAAQIGNAVPCKLAHAVLRAVIG